MRHALIAAIRAYQRHLSPRKGYGCAYRLMHGGSGCSGVGLRLVRRYGVWQGTLLVRERLRRCRTSRGALISRQPGRHAQRGNCDVISCCDVTSCCYVPGSFVGTSRSHKTYTTEEKLGIALCLLVVAVMAGIVALHWI